MTAAQSAGYPPLRVLHVINRLSPSGGAETSLVQCLPHLRQRSVASAVLTVMPHKRGSRVAEVVRAGTPVRCLDSTGRAQATAATRRRLAAWRPDLVHASLHEATLVSRLAAMGTGVPVVVSLVNTPYTHAARTAYVPAWRTAPHRWLDSALSRHATTAFHAISQTAAEHAIAQLGLDPDTVTVIPRGRDRRVLGEPGRGRRALARRRLGIAEDQRLVLSVGRQERQKAQHVLVEAIASVRRCRDDVVLVIAGREGANSTRLRDAIARHGLTDSVRVLGVREDVPELLAAADVFAFSSEYEGLGGAVLEAMAMQVPVAATDCPAVAEALGGTGSLVPPGDAQALGAAIEAYLVDPALAERMASAGRRRFDTTFEIGQVAGRMSEWYRSVTA